MNQNIYYSMAAVVLGLFATLSFAATTQSEVLRKVYAINNAEVRLGQLAESKGSTAVVREYGRELVRDHTNANLRVAEIAKVESVELSSAPDPIQDEQKANETKVAKKLDRLKGAEFDRAFVDEMAKAHAKTLSELQTAYKDLKGTSTGAMIQDLMPTLRRHENMATRIESSEDKL